MPNTELDYKFEVDIASHKLTPPLTIVPVVSIMSSVYSLAVFACAAQLLRQKDINVQHGIRSVKLLLIGELSENLPNFQQQLHRHFELFNAVNAVSDIIRIKSLEMESFAKMILASSSFKIGVDPSRAKAIETLVADITRTEVPLKPYCPAEDDKIENLKFLQELKRLGDGQSQDFEKQFSKAAEIIRQNPFIGEIFLSNLLPPKGDGDNTCLYECILEAMLKENRDGTVFIFDKWFKDLLSLFPGEKLITLSKRILTPTKDPPTMEPISYFLNPLSDAINGKTRLLPLAYVCTMLDALGTNMFPVEKGLAKTSEFIVKNSEAIYAALMEGNPVEQIYEAAVSQLYPGIPLTVQSGFDSFQKELISHLKLIQ